MSQTSHEKPAPLLEAFFPIQRRVGNYVLGHAKANRELAVQTTRNLTRDYAGLEVGRILLQDLWDIEPEHELAFDEGFGLGVRLFMAQAMHTKVPMPHIDAFKVDESLKTFDDYSMSPEDYIEAALTKFEYEDPYYVETVMHYLDERYPISLPTSDAIALGSVSAYKLMNTQCEIADFEQAMKA